MVDGIAIFISLVSISLLSLGYRLGGNLIEVQYLRRSSKIVDLDITSVHT